LNKSTKIWLNYVLGAVVSAVLLWGIYIQVQKQLAKVEEINAGSIWATGPVYLICLVILLMPVNIALEAKKWQLLAGTAQRMSFGKALSSMLAGLAFSLITPNRIGEYPGRILYLRPRNTFRLISVSILGAIAQSYALFIFGCISLIYYNIAFPGTIGLVALIVCLLATIGLGMLYMRFERWSRIAEKIKWLRKFNMYGQLLRRFTNKEQLTILAISMLRFTVYTAQYLIFLRWMNVILPPVEGFLMSALFFWVMAIIPTLSLVELGERGQVSLYLFHHFSDNTVGILTATIGLWCINLILPAIIGCILLLRMRYIK
jgi:Lysylphosphatidylglycerol synthase TM region